MATSFEGDGTWFFTYDKFGHVQVERANNICSCYGRRPVFTTPVTCIYIYVGFRYVLKIHSVTTSVEFFIGVYHSWKGCPRSSSSNSSSSSKSPRVKAKSNPVCIKIGAESSDYWWKRCGWSRTSICTCASFSSSPPCSSLLRALTYPSSPTS